MTNCKICKNKIKGNVLSCSKGTICMECSKDINMAGYQPIQSSNDILWCLAETFFKKGQGEETNFEQVWRNNKNSLTLVKFEELINLK